MDCPICYYSYDSTQYIPMVGTCGHSVCQQCVSRLEDGKCPLCIKVTMTAATRNFLALKLCQNKPLEKSSNTEDVAKNKTGKFSLNVYCEGDLVDYPTFTEDDFSSTDLIGEGNFGHVFHAYSTRLGAVAVKIYKGRWSFGAQRELFYMLKESIHPNIVRFLGVLLHPTLKTPTGIVMEYMEDKTVYVALHNNPMTIDSKLKYSWICQSARALNYLHSRKILHRDIKTSKDFKILKICDMGTMRNFNCIDTMTGGFDVGTLLYNAPEVTKSKRTDHYDSGVDIYSLSICIWEILTRRKPFDHITENNPFQLALMVAEQDERPIALAIDDHEIRTQLERGWHKNNCERPTAGEISAFFEIKLFA